MRSLPLLKSAICCLSLLACLLCAPAWAQPPQRIVSMSLCTDQLLLMIVEHQRIAALTAGAARKEESYMAEAVGNIPLHHSGVEEIIALQPDLIVGGTFAALGSARLLQELGYRVVLVDQPTSLEQVRHLIRNFGEWTGSQARAQRVLEDMDQRLWMVQQRHVTASSPGIVVYSPNGYTIGSNTLEDDIFRAAGFRNLAAEQGIEGFQTISLEQLVALQPDFIQIDNHLHSQHSLASAAINHPVLKTLLPEERRLYMPTTLRDCAGPMVVEAIEYLASHRQEALP